MIVKIRTWAHIVARLLCVLFALQGCSTSNSIQHTPPRPADHKNPQLKDYVSALSWGFDEENSTQAIQSAINSGADTVLIPNVGKPWYVDPIVLTSEQTLILEEGVTISARKGSFLGRHNYLFSAVNEKHISIIGYGAIVEMRKADYRKKPYEKSEWRHKISLKGCSDVLIEGMTIRSSGGDGIYIGRGQGEIRYCENVIVKNLLLEDHYRQGISVVSVQNLLIENVKIYDTGGTAPSSGIDFEPNNPSERLSNCVVRNCEIQKNGGAGILLYFKKLDNDSYPVSIHIENCTIKRNLAAVVVAGLRNKPMGKITSSQNSIRGLRYIQRSSTMVVNF
jgi:hypothetical protein